MTRSVPRWAAGLAAALLLAAAIAAATGAEAASPPPPAAFVAPLQPIVDQPAPAESHRFGFGQVRVTPSTLVAGAPSQSLRVSIDPSTAPAAGVLDLRVFRPEQPDGPRGYNITHLGLASRSVAFDAAQASAVWLPNLNPAPGDYRVDVLDPSGPGPARLLGSAPVVVYAQNRLPPAAATSLEADPARADGTAGGSRTLAVAGINNNVSNEPGGQQEVYDAVQPNNSARVIAAPNPASGRPEAFISNDSMKPGTITRVVLPATAKLASGEGGGTFTPNLCCDPTFAADDRGNFWYGVVSTPNNTSHIVVNRIAGPSGTSLQAQSTAVPRATNNLQDKPMIGIDSWAGSPKRYRLYATWVENPGENVVLSQCDATSAANCDNPDSWSAPVHIDLAAKTYSYPSVAAAPNGDVYVVWWDQTDDSIQGTRCLAASNCALAGSWSAPANIDDNLDPAGTLPFFCSIISAPGGRVGPLTYVRVGPDSKVYVSWSELRANGTTECSESSTDRTFDSFVATGNDTLPALNTGVRLSDDLASAANDHYFVGLAADPTVNNTVEASLYSTKADPSGETTQQYYVASTDGGGSFGPMQQITTAASDFSGANSDGFDYGDYEGADATGGTFYPAWTDNRTPGNAEMYMLTPAANAPSPPAPVPADTTAPNTKIGKHPKKKTRSRKAKFTFSSSEAGSGFRCKLDRKAFAPCTSPKKLKRLKLGKHKFQVEAIDPSGNIDPTPAVTRWKILP